MEVRRASLAFGHPVVRMLILALVVLFLLACPHVAMARSKSLTAQSVDLDATLDDTGALTVVDTRELRFDGDWNGVYWTIGTKDTDNRDMGASVTGVSVERDGTFVNLEQSDSQGDGTYEVTADDDQVTVKVYTAHHNETAKVRLEYTYANIGLRWDDTSELYWAFITMGTDSDVTVKDVTCTVHLPVPSGEAVSSGDNVKMWGIGPLSATVTASGNDVVCKVPSMGDEKTASVRIAFPASWLTNASGANVQSGNRLGTIMQEEQANAVAANVKRGGSVVASVAVVAVPGLALVGALVTVFMQKRAKQRQMRERFDGTYFRDVPTSDHPAVLGALLRQGAPDGVDFTATLMRLTSERRIRLDAGGAEDQQKRLSRTGKGDAITLTRLDEAGAKRVASPAAGVDGAAAAAERIDDKAMDFVFGFVGTRMDTPESVKIADFKSLMRSDRTAYATRLNEWSKEVSKACMEQGYFARDLSPLARRLGTIMVADACVGVLLLLVGWIFFGLSLISVVASLVLIVACVIVCNHQISSEEDLSPKGAEVTAKLEALRRWLKEFTHLEEAVPQDIALWDRLLVMAVVLGVSDEVVRQLKTAAPQVIGELESNPGYGWHYWGVGYGTFSAVSSVGTVWGTVGAGGGKGTWASVGGAGGGFSSGDAGGGGYKGGFGGF